MPDCPGFHYSTMNITRCTEVSIQVKTCSFYFKIRHNRASNKVYECVDENPESIDGSGADDDGALFYYLRCVY